MENEKVTQRFGKRIARVSVDGKNLMVEVSNGAFFLFQKKIILLMWKILLRTQVNIF